jgi:hypothetical protein
VRFSATKPAKRVAVLAALGVGLLTATGCGYINAQQTTHVYSASDGVRADVGSLQLRNMLIVSADSAATSSASAGTAGGPGRLVGTVFNPTEQDMTLTFKDGSSTVRIDVPKKGEVQLAKPGSNVSLSHAGGIPGALAKVSFTAGSTSQDVQVPIVDGTLSEYRQYIPSPSGSASATPSGSATGPATAPASPSESASATPSR